MSTERIVQQDAVLASPNDASTSIPSSPTNVHYCEFKVVVVGNSGVGLIKQYIINRFSDYCKPTLGVDFGFKDIEWDTSTLVRIQLWDVSGQDRFLAVTKTFYRNSVAALIVFDISQPNSFEKVLLWKKDIENKVSLPNGDSIPCFLVANKIDLKESVVDWQNKRSRLDEFCRQHGFVSWTETSAKENINLGATIQSVVHKVLGEKLYIRRVKKANVVKVFDQGQLPEQRKQLNNTTCCGSVKVKKL